jgi:hypothetical protein
MPEFESHRSYDHFKKEVLNNSRYVRSERSQKFLEALVATASSRSKKLKEEQGLWRAQKGSRRYKEDPGQGSDSEVVVDVPLPYAQDRMKPEENKATEGRANPKGIPHLYAASKKRTAVTEVRPWVGSQVTVALLQTTRELQLVDCSKGGESKIYLEEPPPEERDEIVWRKIDRAFSRPISKSDDVANYAPTQIIADLFRQEGYDGIIYQSSLGDGLNIVLFDLDAAEVVRTKVVYVNSVEVDFRPDGG